MDTLKPATTLTSSLLATKGAATPAMPGASRGALAYLPRLGAWPRRLVASKKGSARSRGKGANGRARGTGSAAGDKATVNVWSRLDSDRHLRLKLLAAHSHRPMRECLEEAVELYLASSGPAVRGGGCPRVVDRGDPENKPVSKECV